MSKIKIDIWSDIRCPFCYLGKRRFEAAWKQFHNKENVEVEWHSFELDPYLVTQPGRSVYDHLAEQKGMTLEQSVQAHQQVVQQAKMLGLEFNFDKGIVANSFNAHRLAHFAKKYHLQHDMEERLFKAYFTDGLNIADISTLVILGKEAGLPETEMDELFSSDNYNDNVRMDEAYARELRITGVVPFFLFNEKILRYWCTGSRNISAGLD
ncbi:MAG: DsbA family oxidoreductase [Bacteroidales bacterium]|nr:DsbA family oxidoreductase [Bacteroidales bacterium]